MYRKILCFLLLSLMFTSLVLAHDYYLVEPGSGRMQKVEKQGETFMPVKGERPVEPKAVLNMNPGFIDTTQMNYFESGYYFPDRDSNTVLLQYFKSEFACSLVAVGFTCYSAGYAEGYVWEAPDPMPESTEDLLAYHQENWDFDTIANNWVSIPPVLHGPDIVGSDEPGELTERIVWMDLDEPIDIGTNYVGAGFRIIERETGGDPYGGKPWPLGDDFAEQYGFGQYEPCLSWMYRVHHIHPTLGEYHQWVDYGNTVGDWRFLYVIDIYVNAPPSFISYTALPGTYITEPRTVSASLYDFGVPSEMAGVDEANLIYWTDADTTPVVIPMDLVSGDATEGTYEAEIPGQTPWVMVSYKIEAVDLQGVASYSSEITYVVGEGGGDHILLYLETDAYYGEGWSWMDPVSAVSVDFPADVWDESVYGPPDQSVFDWYARRHGEPGIFWMTWSGFTFAEDTNYIADFLDRGGDLFISGQDLLGGGFGLGFDPNVTVPEGHWARRYLGVNEISDDYYGGEPGFTVYGVSGDPITDDFQAGIDVAPYYFAGPGYNYAARFDDLIDGAEMIFFDGDGGNMGYRYDSGVYQIVFIPWPINYIGTWDTDTTVVEDTLSQKLLAENMISYFAFTGIEENGPSEKPRCYLYNAAPNPFAHKNVIRYAISKKTDVSIKVYDITGKVVNTLVNSEVVPGVHNVIWDGTNWSGDKVSAGVYFYKMTAGDFKATRKTILIR